MTRTRRIFNEARRRGIPHLAHITLVENLPSIFEHGLLSRQEIQDRKIEALGTDPDRRDGKTEAICVTVTRLQETYLKKLRKRYPRDIWAILAIRPDVLWENECLFCDGNASSNRIRNTRRNLSTSYAFKRLFDDHKVGSIVDESPVQTTYRNVNKIPPSVPTDPQAEVLVKGKIPPEYIEQICVEDECHKDNIMKMLIAYSRSETVDVIAGRFEMLSFDSSNQVG